MLRCGEYLVKCKRKKIYRWKYSYLVYYSSKNVERGCIMMESAREIRNHSQARSLELWLNDYLGPAAKPVIREIQLIRKYRVG